MLKILYNKIDNTVNISDTVEQGYEDITSISMWIGVVEKYGIDRNVAIEQCDLILADENLSKKENPEWVKLYKNKDLLEVLLSPKQA